MNKSLKQELLEEIQKPAVKVPMKKVKRKKRQVSKVLGQLTQRNLRKLEQDDFFTEEI